MSKKSLEPKLWFAQPANKLDDCACPNSMVLFSELKDEVENDCACVGQVSTNEIKDIADSLFIQAPETSLTPLGDAHWLIFNPYNPTAPGVINEAALRRWMDFSTPHLLTEPIDRLMCQHRLIQPVHAAPVLEPGTAQVLTAWLQISNDCNLDCPYCYVVKSADFMKLETGLRVLEDLFALAKAHHFPGLRLKYAGGEPTLQMGLIRALHEQAQKLSRQTDIAYSEIILTNGTLLEAADANWIADHKIEIMVSLDGVGEVHDQLRPARNGVSAFQALVHAVDHLLIPNGIRPIVSLTVTGWNTDGIAEAVEWILARGLRLNLNFYRQPQAAMNHKGLEIETERIIQGMLAAYQVIERALPDWPMLDGLLDRCLSSAHLHTCGAGLSYVVIDHEGRTAPCQMLIHQAAGDLADADWAGLGSTPDFHNFPVSRKKGCQTCAFRHICAGGCPLETYRAFNKWDVPSPNCQVYKTLLPAVMRLEGLRLIKYSNQN